MEATPDDISKIQPALIDALLKKSEINDETELAKMIKKSPHLIDSLNKLVDDTEQGKKLEKAINPYLKKTGSDPVKVAWVSANVMKTTNEQRGTPMQTHGRKHIKATGNTIKMGDRTPTKTTVTSSAANSTVAASGVTIKAANFIPNKNVKVENRNTTYKNSQTKPN